MSWLGVYPVGAKCRHDLIASSLAGSATRRSDVACAAASFASFSALLPKSPIGDRVCQPSGPPGGIVVEGTPRGIFEDTWIAGRGHLCRHVILAPPGEARRCHLSRADRVAKDQASTRLPHCHRRRTQPSTAALAARRLGQKPGPATAERVRCLCRSRMRQRRSYCIHSVPCRPMRCTRRDL